MKKEDFRIGTEFYTAAGKWRCTDIGTRVIVAIRIDQVRVRRVDHEGNATTEIVVGDLSWFNVPPYAVAEHVFDEYGVEGCSLDPADFRDVELGDGERLNGA